METEDSLEGSSALGDATVFPASHAMGVTVPALRVALRSYLSTHQLWAAQRMSRLVGDIEAAHEGDSTFDIEHRAFAMGAVFASVAFLESCINELYQDVVDGHGSYTTPLAAGCRAAMSCFWTYGGERSSALAKYQAALCAAGLPEFDRGRAPFQDAAALVRLRNALMHFKPETKNLTDYDEIEALLGQSFAWNKLMTGSGNPFFPDHCLGHGCTEWAHRTAKALVDQFAACLDLTLNYQRAKFPQP